VSISDTETRKTINQIYKESKILLEPHGAVGFAGMKHFLNECQAEITPGQIIITLETAHPAKFSEEVRKILSIDPDRSDSFVTLDEEEESYELLDRSYHTFKEYILDKF
jgi:threonine synthase